MLNIKRHTTMRLSEPGLQSTAPAGRVAELESLSSTCPRRQTSTNAPCSLSKNPSGRHTMQTHRLLVLTMTILLFAEAASAQTASTPTEDDSPAGVGIALVRKDGHFYVGKPLPDAAAIASKLIHEGDRILAVGDATQAAHPVAGRTIEDVVTMIRGKVGTRVRLTVVRADEEDSAARDVLLTRGKLKPLDGLHLDGRLLNPGSSAPDLPYLRLNDQHQASLAAGHRGKIVALEFWATWCGPCQGAMAELQKTAARFVGQRDKIEFLTISMDGDAGLDKAGQRPQQGRRASEAERLDANHQPLGLV